MFAPQDEGFDVRQLTPVDKLKIALTTPKPMILRPRFFDTQADDDTATLVRFCIQS
jgi:hypothetical protein